MPLPPPNLPNISRVVCHYNESASGANAVSVFHVLSAGASALDVFNRFSTAWDAQQMGHAPPTARLHTISITRLDNLTASEAFTTVGIKWDGLAAGECYPAASLLVKYSTGFRGLASIGHTFPPFVSESVNESGRVYAAGAPAITAAWVAFVNTLDTQTIPLQVVSLGRADHPTLPDAPATNHTVTAVTVSPILSGIGNRQSRLRV